MPPEFPALRLPDPRAVVDAYYAEVNKAASTHEEIGTLTERAATMKLLITLGLGEIAQYIAQGKHRT